MPCLWVLISSYYSTIPWLTLSSFSCFSFRFYHSFCSWNLFQVVKYSRISFPLCSFHTLCNFFIFGYYRCFVLLLRFCISTNSSKKSKKISRHKQPNTLPDGAVGALQFCSSELSPQSSAPSQIQSLLTHTPLAQVIWNDLHGHFSSSELSKQSNEPSHRHAFLMQLPSLHWNWLGKQGVAVVIVGIAVEGSVFAFVVTGGSVCLWFFDNAIERRNLFKCIAIQCSTHTMVLNLSKLPYALPSLLFTLHTFITLVKSVQTSH